MGNDRNKSTSSVRIATQVEPYRRKKWRSKSCTPRREPLIQTEYISHCVSLPLELSACQDRRFADIEAAKTDGQGASTCSVSLDCLW